MNALAPYFEQFALLGMEKREKLSRIISDRFLELDIDAGIARFGKDWEFPFQVLGTESDNSFSWLWAWADEQAEMPPNLMTSSLDLKMWLMKNGLDEFASPSMDIDIADGTILSVIACQVCKASAFYRDAYDGGALYILLNATAIDSQPGFDRSGLVRNIADLAARYDFSHRKAIRSYLQSSGIIFAEEGETVNALLRTGERLLVEFNDLDKVGTINGEPLG
ncbi:MAG: hypothetical protein M0042_05765 [Nitrospiraceae bacterium]|nr:hypothetical protein [Nitrospiraceae bacterium]